MLLGVEEAVGGLGREVLEGAGLLGGQAEGELTDLLRPHNQTLAIRQLWDACSVNIEIALVKGIIKKALNANRSADNEKPRQGQGLTDHRD